MSLMSLMKPKKKKTKTKVQAKPKATFKLHGSPLMFRSTILLKEDGEEEKIENEENEGEDEENDGNDEQTVHQGSFGIRSEGNAGQK